MSKTKEFNSVLGRGRGRGHPDPEFTLRALLSDPGCDPGALGAATKRLLRERGYELTPPENIWWRNTKHPHPGVQSFSTQRALRREGFEVSPEHAHGFDNAARVRQETTETAAGLRELLSDAECSPSALRAAVSLLLLAHAYKPLGDPAWWWQGQGDSVVVTKLLANLGFTLSAKQQTALLDWRLVEDNIKPRIA